MLYSIRMDVASAKTEYTKTSLLGKRLLSIVVNSASCLLQIQGFALKTVRVL